MKLKNLPDNKADSFLRLIRRSSRGRLKILLGYGAGVGKTYRMLLEGHALRAEGIDVVIGLLESHGRVDTENLASGLEMVPRRVEEYRGIVIEEMDTQAIISRRPQVALIDELAHTNAPGSRNSKRYEDIEEILSSGIHVVTTLNIQHLESLYDTVEKELGVKVKERIPDSVLLDADEIVNVDLSAEDLQKRLLEGKIYPQDRIQTALQNFFKDSNLETLRELTLRELASQIDLKRREHVSDEKNVSPDQVMACLSSRGPNSEMLLRYSSRLAGRLNRNWYAVYVQTSSESPTSIDLQTQQTLSSALTLAKQLGALVFTYKGEDIVATILSFAREYRVGHIVIGSPGKISFWQRLIGRRNVVERLIDESRGATIVVIDTRQSAEAGGHESPSATYIDGNETTRQAPVLSEPLSHYLSTDRIIFWDRVVSKDEVFKDLVASLKNHVVENPDYVLQCLNIREQSSSTFLNEGVAIPHARIPGLSKPVAALGIARRGVSDSLTSEPVKIVFMTLTPENDGGAQLRLFNEISRMAKNRECCRLVTAADTPGEALSVIVEWEKDRA